VTEVRILLVAAEAQTWRTLRERMLPSSESPVPMFHLQEAVDRIALCGVPWQVLAVVPPPHSWSNVDQDLRCPRCSRAAGLTDENATE
jgi:hypothetical protein